MTPEQVTSLKIGDRIRHDLYKSLPEGMRWTGVVETIRQGGPHFYYGIRGSDGTFVNTGGHAIAYWQDMTLLPPQPQSSPPSRLDRDWKAVAKLVSDIQDLVSESRGVAGLHRNGDEAPWDELLGNAWLQSFLVVQEMVGSPETAGEDSQTQLHSIEEDGPRDGSVILTDCGFCRWLAVDGRKATWVQCDPDGYAYRDRFDDAFECNPVSWTPVPDWIRKQL